MLIDKNCSACRGDSPPLGQQELANVLAELPGWSLEYVDGVAQLVQTYKFRNFLQALAFTQAVGALAEEYGHHPALLTEWGKVKVSWWTHKIRGLHENDAIMAAKTGQLFSARFAPDKS
ncbi:4a-hydroxytetrahydrobiopterin dehydratase [Cellvibrio sp. KY-GH-1]|uniref:4a-hydroxytetrahydrobiopterin dehydratase n=1 Tax=Cellvibrio sp. KY-GH-1 TaxID=2303332 RepID=UPI0012488618|nr:4a-hydroxytetrahydrobiopterin dehydratase [Cellvibrio sp. KY-GH-1]QEY18679.1 4a-hydroxytetrahydrobiopterin dehydratase [Cellvibrio sp. KY-GH-1]